jgi:hypothetical protein
VINNRIENLNEIFDKIKALLGLRTETRRRVSSIEYFYQMFFRTGKIGASKKILHVEKFRVKISCENIACTDSVEKWFKQNL